MTRHTAADGSMLRRFAPLLHLHAGPLPRWLQRAVAAWRAVLAHPVVNLPLGATVAGIACAAVGPVRQLLVPELAPLHWLWLGLGWVGAAAAPLATMQIGACVGSRGAACAGWCCCCCWRLQGVPAQPPHQYLLTVPPPPRCVAACRRGAAAAGAGAGPAARFAPRAVGCDGHCHPRQAGGGA